MMILILLNSLHNFEKAYSFMYPMPLKWDSKTKQLLVFEWWKFKVWSFVMIVVISLIGCGSLVFIGVRQHTNPHPEVSVAHLAFFWGCLCVAIADVRMSYLAVFKWPEVLPKTMQNLLSFHAVLKENFPKHVKEVYKVRARSAILGGNMLSMFVFSTAPIAISAAFIVVLIDFDPYYFISHYFIGDPIYYDRRVIILALLCRYVLVAIDALEALRVILMTWAIYYVMLWIIITDLKILIQSLTTNHLRNLSLRRFEFIMQLVNQLRVILICNFSVFTSQVCAVLLSTGFSTCVVSIWLAIRGLGKFPFYIFLMFITVFLVLQLFFAILFSTVVSIHGNSGTLILLLRRLTRNLTRVKIYDQRKIMAMYKQSQSMRPILLKCGNFFGFHQGIHLVYLDLLLQFVANSLILLK